jgi:hypothetical protein
MRGLVPGRPCGLPDYSYERLRAGQIELSVTHPV